MFVFPMKGFPTVSGMEISHVYVMKFLCFSYLLIINFSFQVDAERNRISLGMKDFYVLDNDDTQEPSEQENDEDSEDAEPLEDAKVISFPDSGFPGLQSMDVDSENPEIPALAQAESRASIPPLEVTLDDTDQSYVDNTMSQKQEQGIDMGGDPDVKGKKQAKRKAKEERYFSLFLSLF